MARSRRRRREDRRRAAPLAPRPLTRTLARPSRRSSPYPNIPVVLTKPKPTPLASFRPARKRWRAGASPQVIIRRQDPQRVRNPASVRAVQASPGAAVRSGTKWRVRDVSRVTRTRLCLERRKRREELFRQGVAGKNRRHSPGVGGYMYDALSFVRCK